jgi:FkbM family methyltransferase
MSINICHFLKGATIYAFEPGPNQFKYLLQNVIQNNLGARIFPFNLALSSKSGQIEFHIHNVKDSSGDGIIDTGRAGESRIIRVESTTLDDWWTQSNKPKVNFIKIDTEGAELQILNSANQLIQQYRPPILLEICYLNYEKYGLQFEDYIITLNSMNYTLFDLKQQNAITCSNYLPYKDHFYYLALPNAVENN